jgi:hypothetical protein
MSTVLKRFPVLAVSSLVVVCFALGGPSPARAYAGFELGTNLSHFVMSRVAYVGKADAIPRAPTYMEWHTTNETYFAVDGDAGITNVDRQEEILSAAKMWQTTNQNMAKVKVCFYRPGGYFNGVGLPPIKFREESIVLRNWQPNRSPEPSAADTSGSAPRSTPQAGVGSGPGR